MGIGLSAAELAQMRADVALMLPDTCSIYRNDGTVSSTGADTDSFTLIATVNCRLDPVQSRAMQARELIGREVLVSDRVLTVAYNADIQANFRVTINSENYEIVALLDDHSWRVSRRAYLAKVE